MQRLQAALAGPSLTCVNYHHFAASECPATRHLGITTHPDHFALQLDYFARHYEVIGLDELLAGKIGPRSLLITIDDSYRSVFEIAAPLLKSRRLPAVLFANPKPIAERFVPMDNFLSLAGDELVHNGALARVIGATGITSVGTAISHAVSRHPADISRVKAELLAYLSLDERDLHARMELFLTPEHVRGLSAFGIEVANHTMSHVRCRYLDSGELKSEIVGARDALAAMTGRPVRAFAYPWGQASDATPEAVAAIRASGHEAQFLMLGRRNSLRPSPDIWYRVLTTNETGARLRLALDVLPRLRSLRRVSMPSVPGAAA